jgi:hypothetical protein
MAIFRKKHSTYLQDLSAYNAARDHMLTSGTYDDYYGEVLDSRGRILEAPTTPERPTSPPDVPHRKSRRTISPPKFDCSKPSWHHPGMRSQKNHALGDKCGKQTG